MSARSPNDLTQPFRVGPRKSAAERFGGARPAATDTAERPSRAERPVARLFSAIVEPIWYWLDLLGSDDQPSNAKIVATGAITVGLVILLVLAGGMAAKGTNPDEWFVVLALGIIGGAAGWDLMKARTKTRAAIDALRSGVVPGEPPPPAPEAP